MDGPLPQKTVMKLATFRGRRLLRAVALFGPNPLADGSSNMFPAVRVQRPPCDKDWGVRS